MPSPEYVVVTANISNVTVALQYFIVQRAGNVGQPSNTLPLHLASYGYINSALMLVLELLCYSERRLGHTHP
jgi:hypothetical protein